MNRDKPKQAFAAREAHEALLELKKVVDDAAKTTHAAELESFYLAINQDANDGENDVVRRTLQDVAERLQSSDFEVVLSEVREKLETAASS
jgi:hypothetical protein